jgi:hypothetical protein
VTFDLGIDTSSVMVTDTNLATGKVSPSPWTSFPLLKETTPGFNSKSTNVSPGSYLITVIAANGDAHQSQVTKSITLAAPPGPGAISGLTAEWNAEYTGVEIQRSQGPGTATTSFELQRYVGQDTPNQTPTTLKVSGSPYTDTPPEISATSRYTYQLVAINAFGQTSAVSNELAAPTAPSHPKNVKAKWVVKHTKASVSWDPVDHAENYELLLLRYDLVGNMVQLEDHTGITSTSFSEHVAGTANLWYQYFVTAHNKFGSRGTYSNSLTVPAPPSSPVSTTSSPTSTHPVVAPKAGG